MTIKFGEWKDCTVENPKTDGDYLIVGFYKNKITYATSLSYLVQYGWNVHIDYNGDVHTDHRMDFSNEEPGTKFWCTSAELVGDTDNDTNS